MNDPFGLARLAELMLQAFAANARIAGMEAENQHRADRGLAQAYAGENFMNEAATLEECARAARLIGEVR